METFDMENVIETAIEVKNKLSAWLKSQPGRIPQAFEVSEDFVIKQRRPTVELYCILHGHRWLAATFKVNIHFVSARCEYANGATGLDLFETADRIENLFNDGLSKAVAEWMKEYESVED